MKSVIISEKFKGVIWRMETDALTDTIFIESRNAEEHLASFTAIDLNDCAVLYKDLSTGEKWLTGIESVYNGVLLLHGYQNENSPVHKGLTAIDRDGKMLWSNYTYAFDHLSTAGPLVYNIQIQPKKLFLIDVHTGQTVKNIKGFEPEAVKKITYPEMAFEPSAFDLPATPIANSTFYINHNNLIIVSLHAVGNPGFNQHLYVLQNGAVVFEDILNTGVPKLQPEAFILFKNYLVYIKNKSQLKVIDL